MLFSAFLMTSCMDVGRISTKLVQKRNESVTMTSLRQRHFQAFARRHVSKISRATKESVDKTLSLKTSSPVHFSTKCVLAISSKEATEASRRRKPAKAAWRILGNVREICRKLDLGKIERCRLDSGIEVKHVAP